MIFIENNVRKTDELCLSIKTKQMYLCDTTLNVPKQLLPQLRTRYQTIQDLSSKPRSRRGLFNGFGVVFKSLFGTLDQNDADYYNKMINKVSSNDQHLTDLLKDTVQIIGSTISNFNSSITNMEKNNHLFETNFNKIYNLTTSSSKTLFNLDLKQTLDEHLSSLTLIIGEVNNELISFLDAILLTKTNQIHLLIITPREYLKELSNGLSHLPPSCSYVLPLKM